MPRSTWKWIASLAVSVLLVLATGATPEPQAAAQDAPDTRAELMDLLRSDGLTRAPLADPYRSPAPRELPGGFEPSACAAGEEMFTDVPASSLFCSWIEEMGLRGITGGCTATEFCPGDPVSRGQMAKFVVAALADETPHVVGEPGEPGFGDGGEGDCLWKNSDLRPGLSPLGFFMDPAGIVRLRGAPTAVDGTDGDMACDLDSFDFDNVIFELTADYQPRHLKLFPRGDGSGNVVVIYIIPHGGLSIDGVFFRAGSVGLLSLEEELRRPPPLDGIQFRSFWDSGLGDAWW